MICYSLMVWANRHTSLKFRNIFWKFPFHLRKPFVVPGIEINNHSIKAFQYTNFILKSMEYKHREWWSMTPLTIICILTYHTQTLKNIFYNLKNLYLSTWLIKLENMCHPSYFTHNYEETWLSFTKVNSQHIFLIHFLVLCNHFLDMSYSASYLLKRVIELCIFII